LTSTPGGKNSLSWSPDGQALIYSETSGPMGQKEVELFLYDLDHQKVIQITDTPGIIEFAPVFSPHGDTIAYTAVAKDDHPHIHKLMLMDSDGGNIRQVLETPMDVDSLTWSPDGAQIVFSSNGTETSYYACNDLYMVNVDGSGLKSLTDSPFRDASPNWSPNGEWIVFTRATCNYPSAPGFEQIYTIHSDGSGLKPLADIPGSTYPSWSPWPAWQIDENITITELGANLNLRAAPSLSGDVLEKLEEGVEILVLAGPIEADEFLWWRVLVIDSNLEGWVAEAPGWFAR
jgi:Tol biopolymer transport system component